MLAEWDCRQYDARQKPSLPGPSWEDAAAPIIGACYAVSAADRSGSSVGVILVALP
jgi:hypothetical protein